MTLRPPTKLHPSACGWDLGSSAFSILESEFQQLSNFISPVYIYAYINIFLELFLFIKNESPALPRPAVPWGES